ncbi:OsmC family protein [Crossiella sp. CA198]|uniref:OsmC family protein n=1 Tax=Crossiella sp. CA198 TaxID=3455607 RepID=UPI003F8D3C7D
MDVIEPTPVRRAEAVAVDEGRFSPEQLHAEAMAGCLWHAVAEAAGRLGVAAGKFRVAASSQFVGGLNGEYSVEVVATVFAPGLSAEELHGVVREADRLWPYTSGNWGRIAVRVGAGD